MSVYACAQLITKAFKKALKKLKFFYFSKKTMTVMSFENPIVNNCGMLMHKLMENIYTKRCVAYWVNNEKR